MKVSNSNEPFNNVEEGLKISHFTVYDRAQNSLYTGLKYYARKWHKRKVKKQVPQGSLKQ